VLSFPLLIWSQDAGLERANMGSMWVRPMRLGIQLGALGQAQGTVFSACSRCWTLTELTVSARFHRAGAYCRGNAYLAFASIESVVL